MYALIETIKQKLLVVVDQLFKEVKSCISSIEIDFDIVLNRIGRF